MLRTGLPSMRRQVLDTCRGCEYLDEEDGAYWCLNEDGLGGDDPLTFLPHPDERPRWCPLLPMIGDPMKNVIKVENLPEQENE